MGKTKLYQKRQKVSLHYINKERRIVCYFVPAYSDMLWFKACPISFLNFRHLDGLMEEQNRHECPENEYRQKNFNTLDHVVEKLTI